VNQFYDNAGVVSHGRLLGDHAIIDFSVVWPALLLCRPYENVPFWNKNCTSDLQLDSIVGEHVHYTHTCCIPVLVVLEFPVLRDVLATTWANDLDRRQTETSVLRIVSLVWVRLLDPTVGIAVVVVGTSRVVPVMAIAMMRRSLTLSPGRVVAPGVAPPFVPATFYH